MQEIDGNHPKQRLSPPHRWALEKVIYVMKNITPNTNKINLEALRMKGFAGRRFTIDTSSSGPLLPLYQ